MGWRILVFYPERKRGKRLLIIFKLAGDVAHNLFWQIPADNNMRSYDGKVSLIDGASATIILCLHVLIAHRIFISFGYVDYFQ